VKSRIRSNRLLDLNEIRLFVEVVRSGSFAMAARRLTMPPNSLSRRVQQLESALGQRLLHRSTRKLSLTAAGRAFFDRCAPPVSELALAGQESLDSRDEPAGLVRIAAPTDFFDVFRLEWIAEFLAAHPRLRLEFVLEDAKADLIADSIDVAFRAGHLVDVANRGQKLFDTHFGLVASPSYLRARGTPAGIRALAAHDCLPQSSLPGPVTWHLTGPDGPCDVEVSGTFRANAARALLGAAIAGLGIALLPELVSAPEVEAGRLVRVLPGCRREGAELYAVHVSRRQIPPAVSAFVDFAARKIAILLAESSGRAGARGSGAKRTPPGGGHA